MQPPFALASTPLERVVGEVETHVAEAGWDQPTQLAATMGLVAGDPSALTPIAQEELGDGPLDEQLAGMLFGPEVLGVVLAREVLVLPPAAEGALDDADDPGAVAATHPQRREVRMVVGVLRGGEQASVLRLRGQAQSGPAGADGQEAAGDGQTDERVTGPDLVPALAAALLATLED